MVHLPPPTVIMPSASSRMTVTGGREGQGRQDGHDDNDTPQRQRRGLPTQAGGLRKQNDAVGLLQDDCSGVQRRGPPQGLSATCPGVIMVRKATATTLGKALQFDDTCSHSPWSRTVFCVSLARGSTARGRMPDQVDSTSAGRTWWGTCIKGMCINNREWLGVHRQGADAGPGGQHVSGAELVGYGKRWGMCATGLFQQGTDRRALEALPGPRRQHVGGTDLAGCGVR